MKANLICFPFSGASAYSYVPFKKFLPPGIDLIPLELPGRGKRLKEPLLKNIESMVDDLFRQLRPFLQKPFSFYGHSMGTVLSYRMVHRLRQQGLPQPDYLFMSGRYGPSVKEDEPHNHSLPPAEFKKKLKEMGGTPDELMQDEQLLDFFEPILRADFQGLDEYVYQETEPLDIPIVVMLGDEEKITSDQAMAWQCESSRPIEVKWFKGKHFFIFDFPGEIVQVMVKKMKLQ
jgi:surfactin synthase thioesterase subunit